MRIAVIGSSGGMGRYFAEYFLSQGHTVVGSDVKRKELSNPRFRWAESNRSAVQGAQVVLIATPIDKTVETVIEVGPGLKNGAHLIEISSLKRAILGKVRPILKARAVRLVSLHPLFGPSLSPGASMKICVIEGEGDPERFARKLFPDAKLIPIGERDHDKAMSVILSLTHAMNIAYSAAVAKHMTPKQFRTMESPTSAVQLSLAEGVLSQEPSLYSYIQLKNEDSARVIGDLIEALHEIKGFVSKKDRRGFERFFRDLSQRYSKDAENALESVYEAFEAKQSR